MKIKEATETREIVIKTYIAEDGKEFKTKTECETYERNLMEDKMEEYFSKNCIASFSDDSGLAGYLGVGSCYTNYVIRADETVCDFISHQAYCYDSIDIYKGEIIILQGAGFRPYDEWYVWGTIDRLIEDLQREMEWAEKIKQLYD